MQLDLNFMDRAAADELLAEVKLLPFYQPRLTVCDRDIPVYRKMFAVGDTMMTYTFGTTLLYAREWTPCTLKLKEEVEKATGCSYNFLLLTLYSNGGDQLHHHMLNTSCIETKYCIPTITIGEPRTLQVKKSGVYHSELRLQHGSLLKMTCTENMHNTTAILEEPGEENCTATLTFLNVIRVQPTYKKAKLDWMDSISRMRDVHINFAPNCSVILKDFCNRFYVDLRHMNDSGRIPTRKGIMMSSYDFYRVTEKIDEYAFHNSSHTIVNNIIMMYLDDMLHLQRINVDKQQHLSLESHFIKLWYAEAMDLKENLPKIQETILEVLWTRFLPKTYYKFLNGENILPADEFTVNKSFLSIVEHFAEPIVKDLFPCKTCKLDPMNLIEHEHGSLREQYEKVGSNCLSLINFENFAEKCAQIQLFSLEYMESISVNYLEDNIFK